MKLKSHNGNYSSAENRKRLVNFLSTTIEGRKDFEPYKPNENDDTFWTLDSANNWKVLFSPQAEPECFEIRYRYHNGSSQHEAALAAWLAVSLNVEVLEDDSTP